ncbi:MAG: glutamine synthetase [Oceanicoccus sp.]|jgi:glutamine synthetase
MSPIDSLASPKIIRVFSLKKSGLSTPANPDANPYLVMAAIAAGVYCELFGTLLRSECDEFAAQVSNVDYEWHLRSL